MKKVHVIGLCGVGMSATALLLQEAGYQVSGSDTECYGPVAEVLRNGGIIPTFPYSPTNIPEGVDRFMIGRNAKLAPEENEEVRAALAQNKPVSSFPEIIGELTKDRHVVVVAGSYGKSSTTSILAHVLQYVDPTSGYFIGATPLSLPAPAKLGTSIFVAEGDEYPSAHDDARAKFLHLHPNDIILTSVVHDHVNVYPTFEDYKKPFIELLSKLPKEALVVACADEPESLALSRASGHAVVSYGVDHGDYRATDIIYGETTHFTLIKDNEALVSLSTTLLGKHNVENIVAVSAYLLERKLVTPVQLQEAVASFAGVRRRLDRAVPDSSLLVYEGFGSSYEKARSAIDAIRLHFPTKKLIVLFEPHTFGWRNRANFPWYDDVFKDASTVFVAAPATQGAATHDQLTREEIIERIEHSGTATKNYEYTDPGALLEYFSGDEIVLVLTSGDFEGSLPDFFSAAAEKFPR